MTGRILERRALQLKQHPEHAVYIFSLRPSEVLQVADISRIDRDDAGKLIGYQRDEVRSHVDGILTYLDSGSILFPNALVLSFNESVIFRRSRGPGNDDGLASAGVLEIPLAENGGPRPAWIVDGQQRALALARTKNSDLAVPVVAFAGGNVDLQRDQFLRVNSTRPLPRGLITELLPEVDTSLPRRMAVRRLPSAICEKLNNIPMSPFYGLIRRTSFRGESAKRTVVHDGSMVEMIRERIRTPNGCLFLYHNVATGETDTEAVLSLLVTYWRAVRDTFPTAWGQPAHRSRLMHGVGIRAVGNLMDAIMGRVEPHSKNNYTHAKAELARIAPLCRWTAGNWEGLNGLNWKALENTPSHIKLLTNHLVREYHLSVRQG